MREKVVGILLEKSGKIIKKILVHPISYMIYICTTQSSMQLCGSWLKYLLIHVFS
jgi:uncharacterized membrane protein YhfC